MFLAATNKTKRLLYLSFCQHVTEEELKREQENLAALLADLPADFRVLADLGQLNSMDVACATEIGRFMEACNQKGVELVVRVIPDPQKDIGLNILALFHYRKRLRMVTCKNMEEAATQLAL